MTIDTETIKMATKHLSSQDPVMKALFIELRISALPVRKEGFSSMAKIIIGQQLSNAAATTIYNRFLDSLPARRLTPISALETPQSVYKKSGISGAKTRYVKELAIRANNDHSYFKNLRKLDDDSVIDILCKVPGIGPWSASIYLLFCMQRPNVFCHGDGSLKKAIGSLYPGYSIDSALLNTWAPYKSIACLVLWKWIDTGQPKLNFCSPSA